jgi:hypothetical protein
VAQGPKILNPVGLGEDIYCRECREIAPPEEQQCFIPTQPDTNQREDVCSACGSADIISIGEYWAEIEAREEGER